MRKKTVLVVNAGDVTGINFCRSLQETKDFHIIGVESGREDYFMIAADQKYLVPAWDDPSYISVLNRIIERHDVDLLYAADTGNELLTIAKNRHRIKCRTFLPAQEDIEVTEDKWATYNRLKASGVPVPATVLVDSESVLEDFISQYREVWLRRIYGSGGACSLPTDSFELAVNWVRHHDGWGKFIVSEKLSKRTGTWIGVWLEGELQVCQLRERLYWKYANLAPSGVTGITGDQKTFWDENLHELAMKCVRSTVKKPHGIMCVDFTWGFDGVPYPTEIQASRFYSSIYFLTRSGLNLAEIYCNLALGGSRYEQPVINPIREEFHWIKSVDCTPVLLTKSEYDGVSRYGS
ncbi:carbamoyl phosphate synthase-like protein [compost metagenome]